MINYRDKGAYLLHEFVVMPDHIHMLLTPSGDISLEKAMQLIKGGSSYEIHKQRENKIQIWNAGFHEESVRNDYDYCQKKEYIRMNPVHARLAEKAEDWPYSSVVSRFRLDSEPEPLRNASSGAKAPIVTGDNVGAKAPTPYKAL